MKKCLFVILTAVLCLGLALPATAKVKMGGMLTTDIAIWDRDAESVLGGVPVGTTGLGDDYTEFGIAIVQPFNRLNMKYTSDDGTLSSFTEVRGGGHPAVSGIAWVYAYVDWRFSPSTYLRIGRQTQAFTPHAPQQRVGHPMAGHLIGIGYGNMHGGTTRDSIRLYHKFNDMVRIEFQIMDPDTDGVDTAGLPANALNTVFTPAGVALGPAAVREENVLPRFDLAIPISVGNFKIEPSFTWLEQEASNVAAGSDDDLTCWGASLYVGAGFGPVVFGGEINIGQNLGNGNYVGASANGAAVGYVDTVLGNTHIEDTDIIAWWVNLGFKVGPATIYGIVGAEFTDNDGDPAIARAADAGERDVERWMYGVSVPISVAKGFTIRPELMFYDLDTDAEIGGVVNAAGTAIDTDNGKEWILGVQFMLVF